MSEMIKIWVVGNKRVGKTTLIRMLQTLKFNEFNEPQPTLIPTTYKIVTMDKNGSKMIESIVWEMGRGEKITNRKKMYHKAVDFIIFVVDSSRPFPNEFLTQIINIKQKTRAVVIITKIDIEGGDVTINECFSWCTSHKKKVKLFSAKNENGWTDVRKLILFEIDQIKTEKSAKIDEKIGKKIEKVCETDNDNKKCIIM